MLFTFVIKNKTQKSAYFIYLLNHFNFDEYSVQIAYE